MPSASPQQSSPENSHPENGSRAVSCEKPLSTCFRQSIPPHPVPHGRRSLCPHNSQHLAIMLKRTVFIPPLGYNIINDESRTEAAGRSDGTWATLVNVAPNLYRNPKSGVYYGKCKIGGRRQLHCLHIADRKTADRELSDWLDSARRPRPEVSRSTLEELLLSFQATRIHDSTRLAEQGFFTSVRLFFDCKRWVTASRGSELKAFIHALARKRTTAPTLSIAFVFSCGNF